MRLKNKEYRFERRYFLVVLLILILITGLRSYTIGNDTTQYVHFFEEFKDGDFDPTYRIEIGYQFICFLVGRFTSDPHVFFTVIAVISYSIFGFFILKESKNVPLSLVMLFCLFFSAYTNIIRQGLVMVIMLAGLSSLKKNHYIRAAIIFVICGLIHATGFILLILLLYKKFPRNFIFYVISFTIILGIAFSNSLYFIVNAIAPQYAHYFGGKYDGSGILAVIFYLGIGLAVFIGSYKAYFDKDTNEAKLAMMCNYLMVIFFTLGFSLNLLTRVAQYFLAYSVITLPNAIATYRNKRKISIILSAVLIIYFFLIITLRSEWNVLYPYKFFWEEPQIADIY